MTLAEAPEHPSGDHDYRHEALFYDSPDAFMAGVLPFVRAAVRAQEPILVVLSAAKIDRLREELGAAAEPVLFADIAEVGTNPARIIPAWQQFLSAHAAPGRRMRGIGEPIWAGRSAAELVECERHEALLNVAFTAPDFWLRCPYDTGSLSGAVIDEARRNHPYVTGGDAGAATSPSFPGGDALAAPLDRPLSQPPGEALTVAIEPASLRQIRSVVAGFAYAAGLDEDDVADLVLAVNELASNSIRHAGGGGTLQIWRDDDAVVCEMRDRGRISDPLAGRVEPPREALGGRGLWIANQLCELVQIRAFADGGAVRLHKRLPRPTRRRTQAHPRDRAATRGARRRPSRPA